MTGEYTRDETRADVKSGNVLGPTFPRPRFVSGCNTGLFFRFDFLRRPTGCCNIDALRSQEHVCLGWRRATLFFISK